ncbi:ABC transporter ATP-binding protein [Methanohalophilus portucalensis]|uniref:Molybdate/tungstate import ATP-binding protein WtpC n=2 Tax=Methanohalophilus portucalensis TaxID=39664 RepID=A0A1L9C2I1_9EURY|nr:ATP-binding cassette domain-containing protein [Methanohalophilus portucalensis]ATU08153.1 osmoprotection protein (proV) [Methanohalophilus portucalensis]OJH48697.1 glycine betaine/L-proline ABC transporter ATPase [Methanohalophilus portucalensis FDF-1]RNI10132.1 ATP-binding cassette domain-containing protein [Methanohalophilus portucalensis FDF-1]SMH43826.1 osmoprotectant transport system ATP-binding protein [Methanohalophilus portucalensis FDF-1]
MVHKKLFDRIDSIEIKKVSKKYGNHFAVQNLDITIKGGELIALVGPSGSGKTTTLRMINRMIEPDEGNIFINGKNTSEMELVALRRNIGYVIQNIGLFPHLTIGQNIGLIPKLEGMDKKEIDNKVRNLLEFVSLEPSKFIDRYPRQLSGGQQQRVGLARALVMDPYLLLMDEPFGALDPILRKQLQEEFSKIKEQLGKTIVFVTHDIEEAFRLGDRVAIMEDAKLIQIGTAEELLFSPLNDTVADIVGSERKFRYLDTLTVSSFMQPLDKKYRLSPNMKVETAIEEMAKRDIDIAIVKDHNDKSAGKIELADLLQLGDKNVSLENVKEPILEFSPADPIEYAIKQMQKTDEVMAIIMDNATAVGILFSSETIKKIM